MGVLITIYEYGRLFKIILLYLLDQNGQNSCLKCAINQSKLYFNKTCIQLVLEKNWPDASRMTHEFKLVGYIPRLMKASDVHVVCLMPCSRTSEGSDIFVRSDSFALHNWFQNFIEYIFEGLTLRLIYRFTITRTVETHYVITKQKNQLIF